MFTTVYSGVSLNTDRTKGVTDRFRSLPIWRPAPLVGALLGDCVRYILAGLVIITVGLILGFRPGAGVVGVAAALGLVVLFSFGVSWVLTTLGLLMHTPSGVMNAGFMGIFPLTFISNVFVDPSWLQGVRRSQPDLDSVDRVPRIDARPAGRYRSRRGAGGGRRADDGLCPAHQPVVPEGVSPLALVHRPGESA